MIFEWGWCQPEYLWLKKGEVNLDASELGKYEDKFKHASIFLNEVNRIF